jgi:hypothetical protein
MERTARAHATRPHNCARDTRTRPDTPLDAAGPHSTHRNTRNTSNSSQAAMPTRSGASFSPVRSSLDGELCSAYFHDHETDLPFPHAPRPVSDGWHKTGACACRSCAICLCRIHPDQIQHADDGCPAADRTAEGYALYMKYPAPGAARFTRRYVGVYCEGCDLDAYCAAAAAERAAHHPDADADRPQ